MSFTPFVTGEIGPYGASKRGPLLNFQSGSSIHPDQRIFSFGLGHHQVRKHPQPSCDVGWRRWHETHRQMFKRKGIHRFTRSWGKKRLKKKQHNNNSSILLYYSDFAGSSSSVPRPLPRPQLPSFPTPLRSCTAVVTGELQAILRHQRVDFLPGIELLLLVETEGTCDVRKETCGFFRSGLPP